MDRQNENRNSNANLTKWFGKEEKITPGLLRKKGITPLLGEPCQSPYIYHKDGKYDGFEYVIGRDC